MPLGAEADTDDPRFCICRGINGGERRSLVDLRGFEAILLDQELFIPLVHPFHLLSALD